VAGDEGGRVGRRALLAAGVGGIVATMAGLLGRPIPAAGANSEPVRIGQVNDGSATTIVHTSGPEGFKGQADLADGLVGQSAGANKSGVLGFNTDPGGFGVYGLNNTSGNWGALGRPMEGIKGYSKDLAGVLGQGGAEGVHGQSGSGDGVVGVGNGPLSSGVRGTTTGSLGCGVWGENKPANTHGCLGGGGEAVYGEADGASTHAVRAIQRSPDGIAVSGWNKYGSTQGILGGKAGVEAHGLSGSMALDVRGAARFDRSGVVTIPAGASSATVAKLGGGAPLVLRPGSLVLATPQTNRAGLYVQAAVPNVAKGTVTIYLSKKVSAATKVAWFVIEQTVP
jgi:hypothetical protein